MINIFVCLLLAHVLTDFVLQNNFIYSLKRKTSYGLLIHVLIFFVLSFSLLYPLSLSFSFLIWLFIVSLSHYVIDKIKLFFQRNIIQKELINFFIDQSLHILLLFSFYFMAPITSSDVLFLNKISDFFNISYDNSVYYILLLSILVYVTYGISVLLYYYDRIVDLTIDKLSYNYFSMLIRIIIFLLLLSEFFYIGLFFIFILRSILKKRLIYDSRRFFIENFSLLLFLLFFVFIKALL
jgi:hypothetical protein